MRHPTKTTAPLNRPRAIASGTIFGNVDCYVLEDGSTVLSQRGMLRGLRGEIDGHERGDLGQYLARLPEKYSAIATATNLEFIRPDGGVAIGRPSHDFVAMCRAYAEMLSDGSIHKARLPMARNAVAILSKLAERGIDEIVYEASNWHPRAVVQAPAVDLATIRAAVSEELADLRTRLTSLESSAVTLVNNGGPLIGDGYAQTFVLSVLHEIAHTRARAIKNETPVSVRRLRTLAENELRDIVPYPRGKGKGWYALPSSLLGKTVDALRTMLASSRSLAGVAAGKPVQLSLVANSNGKKGAA